MLIWPFSFPFFLGSNINKQFLYEAGYGSRGTGNQKGKIGITLPRRIGVLATAKRASHELNVPLGKEAGYQVSREKKIRGHCSVKFMTDGILLRELQVFPFFSFYTT